MRSLVVIFEESTAFPHLKGKSFTSFEALSTREDFVVVWLEEEGSPPASSLPPTPQYGSRRDLCQSEHADVDHAREHEKCASAEAVPVYLAAVGLPDSHRVACRVQQAVPARPG